MNIKQNKIKIIRVLKLFFFLVLLSGLLSCNKIRKLKEFDLSYTEDVTVPASTSIINLPFDVITPEITTNTAAEYKSEGTNSKLVEQVTLTRLYLTIKSPTSSNFDFLNSLEIFLSSKNNSEIRIASKNSIPESGLTQLELDVNNENIKNYLADESFSIRVKAVTDKATASDVIITTHETFHIKARIKNVFRRK